MTRTADGGSHLNRSHPGGGGGQRVRARPATSSASISPAASAPQFRLTYSYEPLSPQQYARLEDPARQFEANALRRPRLKRRLALHSRRRGSECVILPQFSPMIEMIETGEEATDDASGPPSLSRPAVPL